MGALDLNILREIMDRLKLPTELRVSAYGVKACP